MPFKPNYKNIVDAALNIEPERVPLYDHSVSNVIIEKITGTKTPQDLKEYFKWYCNFFMSMGYDTVSYELGIVDALLNGGALTRHVDTAIKTRQDLEKYPFKKVAEIYMQKAKPYFDALKDSIPQGMKAIGGIGYGVFEIAQDLVGYENLCIMSLDEPDLYGDVFKRVGDLMCDIWKWFLDNYADTYCVCRFGDDLGYKSNTMLPHADIRQHILPQYERVIKLIHSYDKPFLLHSCGCIFDVMDDIISVAKIDAKHSNEDQIAEFKVWVDKYGDRIGNFGGIDTDHLVRMDNESLKKLVIETLDYCAKGHGGFALGSGNSIPSYVNPEKYLVMVNTARKWRGDFD